MEARALPVLVTLAGVSVSEIRSGEQEITRPGGRTGDGRSGVMLME
jgi:hypothetical protein